MTSKNKIIKTIFVVSILMVPFFELIAQVANLDDFESAAGWSFIRSDAVELDLSIEEGYTGNAIRFEYNFTKGTGYGGIQKPFPIDLPENYEFTFYLKAESPDNNFEIKFIDSTGNNVWWVNNRNYDFPEEWKKITIKKRHIEFAWGPTEDKTLKRIDRIEFTIASYVGGHGTLWLDDLKFKPLPPEKTDYPTPVITASSSLKNHPPDLVTDHLPQTSWLSGTPNETSITVDFAVHREFGGLQIDWLKDHHAEEFVIQLSENGLDYETVYSVPSYQGDVSFIYLPEATARYLKINLKKTSSKTGFGISELTFLEIKNSLTMNDFLIYAAKNSTRGNFPRYFLEQASYWTVTGVNNDVREGLINEDGMVEVEKGRFSIEPMIRFGDSLYNWSNVKASQSLGTNYRDDLRFIPTVTWQCGDIHFEVNVTSSGEANTASEIDIYYSLENLSKVPVDIELYLLIRPYQVNPYYQWLNLTGGAGKIYTIEEDKGFHPGRTVKVNEKHVVSYVSFDDFGAYTFDDGDIVEMLRQGIMPGNAQASDPKGLAGGVMKYEFHLEPSDPDGFMVVVPYYGLEWIDRKMSSRGVIAFEFDDSEEFWKEKTDHIRFNLPASADRIIDTWKANLVYILINRDNAGIQPGSRSYDRSWVRDGSLTSSALLKSGIVQEVRDFIDWYAPYQFDNGKVPCVVDFRGPDPVPEHDSHGQLIYLIREYFHFTGDTSFLREKNEHVLRAVDYIESLFAERSTDHYRYGNDSVRAHYGLVPESISHEGYSAKPMHSYWDNFFIMKGLKDAADIQKILGEEKNYERIVKIRDTFRENLYNSLHLAMKYKGIDYIPGCVELGDFDATSTTIALTPCNELDNLPKPQVYNTFEKYYDYFRKRRDGGIDWVNYTPYENRLIGSFIMLDQPERAHELIEYFLQDQRPQGFYHWAEVVWKDHRKPGFIGDMPHTWVGSDFINAIRSMFVYENEYDQSLVLASALYQDWIDAPEGMSVEHLPTYYGEISYSILKEDDRYVFKIWGDMELPENGMEIRNFNGSKMPDKVLINGKGTKDFTERKIKIHEFPVEVVLYYSVD
jgi:hypothetical protein